MVTPQQRINELRNQLNHHNYKYYVENAPEISDHDFDMLMKELEQLELQNPQFDDPLSPTHRVGSDLTKGFQQFAHQRPMLSLANTYSTTEINDFFERVSQGLNSEPFTIIGELKYDGTSISLTYEHGRLVRAVTRGDGTRGDVVTENVKTIRSIPLQLMGNGWPDSFDIRGEILLPWKEFDRLNNEREFNEEPLFANPRNAASGTLKLQNPTEVARRGLDAVFYYLIGDNLPFDNHFDNMTAARSWGFKTAPVMEKLHTIDEVDNFITHWDTARKELPVATDGLVFKVNSLRQQLNLGYTAKSPRWATAYKFQAERALTKLRFISFEVGRSGTITPVANLDPVLLSGTVVKRASLHNEDIIRTLDIHEGDMLYVEKGGEIIPKITGVDSTARLSGAKPVEFVTCCPICGTKLVRQAGEAAWECPNKLGCEPQICGRIEHFVGRRMMNIDGIGEEIVVTLFKNGWVKDPADLYTLHNHRSEIESLPRFGRQLVQRILDGIEQSKLVPFDRVLFALSIPYVGETGAKRIARSLRSIDAIASAGTEELLAIDDVGPRIAASIQEYFANPVCRDIVERLRQAGVNMEMTAEVHNNASDVFAGKTFVISGTFNYNSRDEYKALIELNGGKNSSSVSKKTDYILAGDNMGPAKLEKAQALGVKMLTEDEFLQMISPQQLTDEDNSSEGTQQSLF
ncbi:MAG: NAD-dependent DNA ligase LigA [Muribaculum sp.]|nr:NAD-dependent DNA ligase LigA [Muribaculaceae bacterium]MCM1080432.1 NAD-dependent DNA ligase LigA [Muribaculum sp.]